MADNVDLLRILQEFEESYEVKYGKRPKVVRRLVEEVRRDCVCCHNGPPSPGLPQHLRPDPKVANVCQELHPNTSNSALDLVSHAQVMVGHTKSQRPPRAGPWGPYHAHATSQQHKPMGNPSVHIENKHALHT